LIDREELTAIINAHRPDGQAPITVEPGDRPEHAGVASV
jgi:hypothetical protein